MAYTANENTAIAISDHPLGPFQNLSQDPVEATVKQIDPYVFIDDDGRKYIYQVRLEEGNKIFVAEMEDDMQTIKPKTFMEGITAEKEWENTENDLWTVAEGPTVIKRNGLYYLIYSANDFRNPDYAVGYATSTSPLGPWKKSGKNPLIHLDFIGENGSGHGDILIGRNGAMYYVFHTHFSEKSTSPKSSHCRIKFQQWAGKTSGIKNQN